MRRLIFFLQAYPYNLRLQLLVLLILERFKVFQILRVRYVNICVVESRRILGFVYDNGGAAKPYAGGMILNLRVADQQKKFQLRWNSSDFLVFEQVIIKREYHPIIALAEKYNIKINTIIDAGGNIGCTAIFLSAYFKQATTIVIEPDKNNFETLRHNLESNRLSLNILQCALWHESTKVALTNNHLDMRDWSLKVSDQGDQNIPTVTLAELFKEAKQNTLDIVKMDIEGAEVDIFEKDVNLSSTLTNTAILAIEIHNHKGQEVIQHRLRDLGFEFFTENETCFAVNVNLLKNRTCHEV